MAQQTLTTPSGRKYILHKSKKIYIYRGQTNELSPKFKTAFKQGIIKELPASSGIAYNEFTKRFVKRDSIYKKDGKFRKQYQDKLEVKAKSIFRSYVKQRFNPTLSMDDWVSYIEKKVLDKEKPFKIILTSGIVANISKEFAFRNFHEFENWVKKLINGDQAGSDPGRAESMDNAINLFDAFQIDKIKAKNKLNPNRDPDGGVYDTASVKYIPYSGGCNHACYANGYVLEKNLENTKYKFVLHNPISQRNDCGLKCLEYILKKKLNTHTIRKSFKIAPYVKITPEQLHSIYMSEKESDNCSLLTIVDSMFDGKIDLLNQNYILLYKEHYYVLLEAELKPYKNVKCKRGTLSFDFETRPDFSHFDLVGNQKSYHLKDTICAIHYRENRSTEYKNIVFITNRQKSSARQFLDWLQEEHFSKRHYNCVAHNGANFDNYFLVSNFTQMEQQMTEMQLRGISIIGMQYYSHLFKDSCCFLTNSLNNLCKQYKIETKKLTSFEYKGITLTNANLCFFKPELDFWKFMDLQHTDKEYWDLYTDYCLHDCFSLTELWKKFNEEVNGLIKKMGSHLLVKCSVMACNTIGSLAKKLVDTLNKSDKTGDFKLYKRFMGDDKEKYEYVCQFKRGGISHCNQAGKHTHEICSYDITSQYPTALINMIVPAGASSWTTEYDENKFGYYTIKNLVFKDNKTFKPIAYSPDDKSSLKWAFEWKKNHELKIGSELLKYCIETQGLLSFEVVSGLVSKNYVKGYQLFGRYVTVLFDEKANQDVLKANKDPLYNPAFREVIKLFLNSVTGKLVEDPSRYFKLQYTGNADTKLQLGGVGVEKIKDEDNMNIWVNAGCCVYDYSKMLLFKYIECLPNGSNDVIHVETDSIYFNKKDEQTFIENVKLKETERQDYPIKIDSNLGNVKREHTTGSNISYFLGKKFYYLQDDEQEVMRIKGIPLKTIDKAGNSVELVNLSFYERIYNMKQKDMTNMTKLELSQYGIKSEFSTLQRNLFGETKITSHRMTRMTRPNMPYKEWN